MSADGQAVKVEVEDIVCCVAVSWLRFREVLVDKKIGGADVTLRASYSLLCLHLRRRIALSFASSRSAVSLTSVSELSKAYFEYLSSSVRWC